MVRAGNRVLLGVTGSIAAVKAPEIVRQLMDKGFDVSCAMTRSAEQFVTPLALATFSRRPVVSSLFGPESFEMPHLRLADENDVVVIAPVSATVLARCANGLAEDMVSLVYITTKAPVVMAPAMHPTMWEHPATQKNVQTLRERGVTFVGPFIGPLADNSQGAGRMSEPDAIVAAVESVLKK